MLLSLKITVNNSLSLLGWVRGVNKAFVNKKEISQSGHTHDDRYFTESEMTTKLNEKANSSHNHSTTNITSGTFTVSRGGTGRNTLTSGYFLRGNGTNAITMSSIAQVKNDLGIGSSSSDIISGNIALGNIISIDGILWKIIHIDYTANEFILCKEIIEEDISFGSNGTYQGSNIFNKCNTFLNSLSTNTKNKLIPKVVHGATSKVWIPQVNWISLTIGGSIGDSSWSGSSVFNYFNNNIFRIGRKSDGTDHKWWTASKQGDFDNIYCVREAGDIQPEAPIINKVGFRPFIALPL